MSDYLIIDGQEAGKVSLLPEARNWEFDDVGFNCTAAPFVSPDYLTIYRRNPQAFSQAVAGAV